ncbi:amidohydrolase family protein [Marinibactrum halimedae]|uniref:Amidohydrolase n=1 Tax=Marinibactrum halimedae TaxID=1444977 RepID=A0AA37T8V3_9GAMM|nr:amidohydrolase family protein [Marinibactrum halimedae]MCD9458944.1 amidohydrolase family protein [Marinibactrum halimedae]GLS26927.1 amidohydrolase [Marinibactrum halimedae]
MTMKRFFSTCRIKRIASYFALATIGTVWATHTPAESIAITNATLYTANNEGTLENATLVFEDGVITSINPDTVVADRTIDGTGKIITPGLIGSLNQLGLVEVSAVASSRDAGEEKSDITFNPGLAYNPSSSAIPYNRKGGVTRSVITPYPSESNPFAGLATTVDLTGELDAKVDERAAVIAHLGAQDKGSRAAKLQQIRNALKEQQQKLAKAAEKKKKNKDKGEPSDKEQLLTALLQNNKPLVIEAYRASDLLALIKLKNDFGLNLIIAGANDAVVVKDALAAAQVPIIMSAMDNLPTNFDALHASLSNAAELEKAGVTVILTVGGYDSAHNLYQLRFDAGNAVANGMSREGALRAITANVATIFNINAGELAVGKQADLVMWSGDPFELSSRVEALWIDGSPYDTESRHDKLRNRYTTSSNMPEAYIK